MNLDQLAEAAVLGDRLSALSAEAAFFRSAPQSTFKVTINTSPPYALDYATLTDFDQRATVEAVRAEVLAVLNAQIAQTKASMASLGVIIVT